MLLSLLARDNRMPHLFGLRAERRVYRYGLAALALAAAGLLVAVDGDTQRLVPLFAIGVFIGFTISQVGLVRHWAAAHPRRLAEFRAAINGFGAVLTATATVVFLLAKFTAGAWIVVCAGAAADAALQPDHAYYAHSPSSSGSARFPPEPSRCRRS